ncbi:unnamed protein product [Calypogeia fissa]
MAGMEVDDGPTKAGSKRNFSRSGVTGRQQQQVCRYWLEGRCNKGDDCQWLHPEGAGTTGRTQSSNGGASKRPNNVNENTRGGFQADGGSGFSNQSGGGGGGARRQVASARWGRPRGSNNSSNVNRTARSGTDGARRPRDKVCTYWLKGNCRRGDDCDYLHAHTASPDIALIKQLAGHDKAVRAIELPVGSSKLYTGGQDETVRVWDCNTGECTNVVQMGGDVGALLSAATWLFIGLPNEVKIWDLQTSAMQSLLFSGQGQVHALAVSADMLFAGTHDGSVLAWKFSTTSNAFEPAASLYGHSGPVITLLVQGHQLYSGSMDKRIKVWDLGTGQCVQTIEGHTNVVMQLLFWDKFLLSCSLDGTVRVWAPTPEGFFEARYTYPEDNDEQGNVRNGALTMSGMDSSGKPVLICSYNDNTVHFYDLPTFSERGTLQTREEVRTMQVGPGGLVFTGEGYGEIKVWRFATGANS